MHGSTCLRLFLLHDSVGGARMTSLTIDVSPHNTEGASSMSPAFERPSAGKLFMGASSQHLQVDDRTLMHLKVVIFAKFRRHESFAFSWDRGGGGGRSSTWLQESVFIRFEFAGDPLTPMNRKWIDDLMVAANSPAGLTIVKEPIAADPL